MSWYYFADHFYFKYLIATLSRIAMWIYNVALYFSLFIIEYPGNVQYLEKSVRLLIITAELSCNKKSFYRTWFSTQFYMLYGKDEGKIHLFPKNNLAKFKVGRLGFFKSKKVHSTSHLFWILFFSKTFWFESFSYDFVMYYMYLTKSTQF